jgi:hypothetical protein
MKSSKVEFLFLKSSIDQFVKDLQKLSKIMKDKSFSEEEELEIMSYLVAVKENIEGIEARYSRL